jgi:hypothetical protein
MKHIFLRRMLVAFIIVSGMTGALAVQAQSVDKKKKTTVKVRVSEDGNGKTKDITKEYQVNSMTDEERKQFVDKVLDSLGVDSKSKSVVSVTIDDGAGDQQVITKRRRSTIMDRSDDREPLAFHWKNDRDFSLDTEKLRAQARTFEREFRPRARMMVREMENLGSQMGEFWNREVVKPSNIGELNVYANNPDNGVLNLRFYARQKGDLNITVTDTKGKEVGKKEIKDFTGEFVGQVDLKKNTKGTLFVTVVQNADGAVKRVVIP